MIPCEGVHHDSTPIFLPDGHLGTPLDIFHVAYQPGPVHLRTPQRPAEPVRAAPTLQRAESFAGLTRKPSVCGVSTHHPSLAAPAPPPRMTSTVTRSTPHAISAPIRTVPTGACSWGISAPMGQQQSPGNSCCCGSPQQLLEMPPAPSSWQTHSRFELMVRVLRVHQRPRTSEAPAATLLEDHPELSFLGSWKRGTEEQLRAFSHTSSMTCHLDELFRLLSTVEVRSVRLKPCKHLVPPPRWVWVAMDPESKLLLGTQHQEVARAPPQRVRCQRLRRSWPPTARLRKSQQASDMTALLTHYGQWVQPHHQRKRPCPSRWEYPSPAALCAGNRDRAPTASGTGSTRGVGMAGTSIPRSVTSPSQCRTVGAG